MRISRAKGGKNSRSVKCSDRPSEGVPILPLWRTALQRARYAGLANCFSYFVTRFHWVRRAGASYIHWARRSDARAISGESLFGWHDAYEIAQAVKERSYALGLELPGDVTEEIGEFANTTPCVTPADYGGRRVVKYLKNNWQSAEAQLGRPIVIGRIPDCVTCPGIRRIANDPLLHGAAYHYLGYPPRMTDARLYWSFATDLGDRERASLGQNVLFHYDLQPFSFRALYFQFYLTDVDLQSGHLELIESSHGPKPLRFLLRSAHLHECDVLDHYGGDNLVSVVGRAGTGFVMDGYCVHRATSPRNRDRLVLQIRMY